jgi:hypothetical protein
MPDIVNGNQTSEDLKKLERLLRLARFHPRESFQAELLGRVRRGEKPAGYRRPSLFSGRIAALLAGLAAILGLILLQPDGRITVDRCCFDLDGGGIADDGARISGVGQGGPFQISVYEDRDGSGDLTPSDIVRFERTGTPELAQLTSPGIAKIQHCCQDFDGEGPADDGIFVLVTPPDRVHSAAIYQLR